MERFAVGENDVVEGFKVVKVADVPQLKLNYYQLEHQKTGALRR